MEETFTCTYESSGFSSMIVLTRALEDEMMECYKGVEGWKEGADGGDFTCTSTEGSTSVGLDKFDNHRDCT